MKTLQQLHLIRQKADYLQQNENPSTLPSDIQDFVEKGLLMALPNNVLIQGMYCYRAMCEEIKCQC